MQDGLKAVWSDPYVSVACFHNLKHNFFAYRSSKMSSRPDCIFEIHQLLQSVSSRVYSNCCCSCLFELEIIEIGQSSHKMYSNKKLNFQESTTILNACAKMTILNLETYWRYHVCIKFCFLYVFAQSDTEELNSLEVLRITQVAKVIFVCQTAQPPCGERVYFYPRTVSLYHNFSVCLDT